MGLLFPAMELAVSDQDEDSAYYRRRAAEELEKARKAETPALAAKHRQLSSIYSSRALQAERRSETEGDGDPAGMTGGCN